jgi:hypothetical protein
MGKFVALQIGAVVSLVILCTQVTWAQTTADATQIISLTTTIVEKELKSSSTSIHVVKMSLSENYAIAQWQQGHSSGEQLFQKKFGLGWVPLGSGAADLRASSLAAYDVPSAMATALVAGMSSCSHPKNVTSHGYVTSVCFVGPCTVC